MLREADLFAVYQEIDKVCSCIVCNLACSLCVEEWYDWNDIDMEEGRFVSPTTADEVDTDAVSRSCRAFMVTLV